MVSTNLRGPGQHWLRRLNNSEVQYFIFDVTHDVLLARMKNTAAASAVSPGVPFTFYLSIDATKVAKVIEVSASHKSIICGAFPNHVFDISNLPKDDVNNVIAGTSELVKINKATEVKVSAMYFQLTTLGVPPSVIVDSQPQGTNKGRNFVQKLNVAAVEA